MITKSLSQQTLAIIMNLAMFAAPVFARGQAQKPPVVRTDTKIVYHNGPLMQGVSNVYMIWYGNWAGSYVPNILNDLVLNLGSSPYFMINALYPDANGNGPNGGLIYSGVVYDSYSHGAALTPSDLQAVVRDHIANGRLPLDPAGIFVILASADITDIHPDGSTFCSRKTPHHGSFSMNGATVKYGFIGNADRCPSTAPWFFDANGNRLATPNDSFGGDVMASSLAHLFSVTVTNPTGSGWYDRYGFENATKCFGEFGTTYQAANGGPANIRIGQRDLMLHQNWVNVRKGYCALAAPPQ